MPEDVETPLALAPIKGPKVNIRNSVRYIFTSTRHLPKVVWKVSKHGARWTGKRSILCTRGLREQIAAIPLKDYSYTDLTSKTHIRILSIHPGSLTQPISCSLEEISLDDKPAFVALSYCWSRNSSWKRKITLPLRWLLCHICHKEPTVHRKDKRTWIICNGKRLSVTENLYECLLQLRRSRFTERIWIDAVCVNQQNISERNSQVLHMPEIYKSAERVIAWLGICPSLLNRTDVMGKVSAPKMASEIKSTAYKLHDPMTFLHTSILRTIARVHLLSRRYFCRAWIIQELLLPERVTFMIGEHTLTPEQVLIAANRLDEPSRFGSIGFNPIDMTMASMGASTEGVRRLLQDRERFQLEKSWSLEQYVLAAQGHQATDYRDLIYAGVSLLAAEKKQDTGKLESTAVVEALPEVDLNGRLIDIDYSAAITVKDVFTDCATRLLRESGLFALSLAYRSTNLAPEGTPKLPTWVPQFVGRRKLLPMKMEFGAHFNAGGNTARVRMSDDKELLFLESGAEHLDHISEVYDSLHEKTLTKILFSLPGTYQGESMIMAVSRTLLADSFDDVHPAPSSIGNDLVKWVEDGLQRKINSAGPNGRPSGFVPKKWTEEEDAKALEKAKLYKKNFDEVLVRNNFTREQPSSGPKVPEVVEQSNHDSTIPKDTQPVVVAEQETNDLEIPVVQPPPKAMNAQTGINRDQAFLETYLQHNPALKMVFLSATPFMRNLIQRLRHRTFFVTKKGYIGLGPDYLKVGQSIMVIPGAYVPFAMQAVRDLKGNGDGVGKPFSEMEKPEEEEDKCRAESTVVYQLRGEVYVHGIMQGERLKSEDWDRKMIVIE